jgi:hypothetical protein
MPSRREFLQKSAIVSAIAANGAIARAGAVAGTPAVTLGRVIYDDRYAEGRRFAAVVGAHGVPTRTLDGGDITRFWYDELEALWAREPMGVTGFTQFGPMFVVERLATERGLRMALRVEHRTAADGTLLHVLEGSRETLALATEVEALRSDWPALMAALAASLSADDSPPRTAALVTPGPAPTLASAAPPSAPSFIHYYVPYAMQVGHGPALDGPVYSWVVAPRAQGD